ncbi:MAG TPA: hypothetical protein VL860_09810 [Planctomycetota bacterium]|jgi:hypothetical protein|nr:hypothetical protein [Planctomycetota bacterium]
MNTWLMKLALMLVVGVAGLGLFPQPAAASFSQPLSSEILTPSPVVVQPAVEDFSDAEFATADQPEFGGLAGGEVVLIFVGGFVVLLVIILLLLLLFSVID